MRIVHGNAPYIRRCFRIACAHVVAASFIAACGPVPANPGTAPSSQPTDSPSANPTPPVGSPAPTPSSSPPVGSTPAPSPSATPSSSPSCTSGCIPVIIPIPTPAPNPTSTPGFGPLFFPDGGSGNCAAGLQIDAPSGVADTRVTESRYFGVFSVANPNPSVASAAIQNNVLTIDALASGSTRLTVSDSFGNSNACQVNVP